MPTNKKAEEAFKQLCKDYNVIPKYHFKFPIYAILPDEVELALKVLNNYKIVTKLEFHDNK